MIIYVDEETPIDDEKARQMVERIKNSSGVPKVKIGTSAVKIPRWDWRKYLDTTSPIPTDDRNLP